MAPNPPTTDSAVTVALDALADGAQPDVVRAMVFESVNRMLERISEVRGLLHQSETRLRAALAAAGLGIYHYDCLADSIEVDAQTGRLIDLDRGTHHIARAVIAPLIHPEDRERVQAEFGTAFRPESGGRYEVRFRTAQPPHRQVVASGQVFFSGDAPVRVVGFVRDITSEMQLEEAVREQRRAMERLTSRQIAMQTAVAIAHELNQPLLAVSTYCDAALEMLDEAASPDPRVREAMQKGAEQARRAGSSLHELIDCLHGEDTAREAFSIDGAVIEAVGLAHEQVGAFRHDVAGCTGLPAVVANRVQVVKVLVNLIRNGVEAAQAAGLHGNAIRIDIAARPEGGAASLTIHDNGTGLREEAKPLLFDPFSSTKPHGMGLGLAISNGLVAANGGHLWFDPPGGVPGATVHFTLPFAP